MASTPTLVQTPKAGLAQINNAGGTTAVTVVTAGASGSKVTGFTAASEDTVARVLTLSVLRSSTSYTLGSFTLPIAAGTDGATKSVNLLDPALIPGLPIDSDGQRYLFLQSGDVLQARSTVAVTSGKLVHLASVHGDF